MKAFLRLGVLCLVVYLMRAEEGRVTVECNLLIFRVLVKKNLLGNGVLVRAEELSLGNGCPVNGQMPDKFELRYSVSECGIAFQAAENHVTYSTYLHYIPTFSPFGLETQHFPLSCTVARKLRILNPYKPDPQQTSVEKRRKSAAKMEATDCGPRGWTKELCEVLEKNHRDDFSEEKTEAWDGFSFTILTLSSVVYLLCHRDIGLPLS